MSIICYIYWVVLSVKIKTGLTRHDKCITICNTGGVTNDYLKA